MANTSISGGGTIKTTKGRSGTYTVEGGEPVDATFHVLKYKTKI
jgi:hypothetical protein